MKPQFYAALTLPALAAPLLASDIVWNTDLPQALAQAAEEEKKVLLVFTGSDWCTPCKEMEKQVLSTREFAQYAQESFVLVELDYPHHTKLSSELAETNQAMAKKYQVQGLPTVLVLDATGGALGGFVGGKKDLASFKQALASALLPHTEFKDILLLTQILTGLDRAKALQMAYEASPEEMKKHNAFLLEEAKAIDTEDTLDLKKQEQKAAAIEAQINAERARIRERLNATGADIKQGLAIVSEELKAANLHPSLELSLLTLKRELLFMTAETPEDILALQRFMKEEFAKRVPAQAKQIIEFANVLPSQTEALLERATRQREAILKANSQTQP